LGRIVNRTSPVGVESYTYDSYGRTSDQKLDGVTYSHTTYDQYSRVDHVDYAEAGQAKLQLARDNLGRVNSRSYTMGTSTMAPGNLLPNPSFEQQSSTDPSQPDGWAPAGWGNNTQTYSYENTGHTGSRSLKVEITSFTDGDAKWYNPDRTTISPNTSYTFRDYYKSSIPSTLILQYIYQDG